MAIRYGFLPRREKQLESLDPEPFLYPSTHPCLAEAMHRSYSSDVWNEERVSELKRRAAQGKSACRFREADLWPVLVKEGIRPDCPCFEDRVLSFAKSSGGPGMINFVLSHFDELKAIGHKLWRLEDCDQRIREAQKTRVQVLEEAAQKPCVCSGRWSAAAQELLMQNGIDAGRLGQAIFNALKFGRASCLLCKQVYWPSVPFHVFDELIETPCWDLCCTRGL